MERSYHRPLFLGLLSHLCAASFPFLAKASLTHLGPYRGALVIYVIAVLLGWMLVAWVGNVKGSVRALASALRNRRDLVLFGVMMVLATISVLLFYGGLNQTTPGDFSFVVRLEHVFALSLGFIVLGERVRMLNVFGALLGFSGWLLVINFGSVRGAALWYAIGYIISSGAASMLAKSMLRRLDDSAFFLLRMTATMLVQATLTGLFEHQNVSLDELSIVILLSTLAGGIMLSLLFFIRYKSMAGLPLWLYSSLSATQMIFTPLFAWLTGKPMTWQVLLGGAIVVTGVTMASLPDRRHVDSVRCT